MISITATNDSETGLAFPIGAWIGSIWEHGRTKRQKQAVTHTMGHIPWMRTHQITLDNPNAPPASKATPQELAREREWSDQSYQDRTWGWKRHFDGGAVLKHLAMDPNNPFWVVEASPEIINGNNGIYQDPFLGFVRKLVGEQLRGPPSAGGPQQRPVS